MKFNYPQSLNLAALRLNLRDEISPFAAPRYARFAVKFTQGGLLIQLMRREFMLNLRAAPSLSLKILKFNSVCAHYALFLPQRRKIFQI